MIYDRVSSRFPKLHHRFPFFSRFVRSNKSVRRYEYERQRIPLRYWFSDGSTQSTIIINSIPRVPRYALLCVQINYLYSDHSKRAIANGLNNYVLLFKVPN